MLNAQQSSPNAKQKKKILLFGSQMETGGAQQNLFYQANWFHNHAYDVTVVFLYDKERLHERWQAQYPFPIINLKARRWNAGKIENTMRLVAGLWRAFNLMRGSHFDTIETFTHHANLTGIPLAWLTGIPRRIATHRGRFKSLGGIHIKMHTWLVNSSLTTCLIANSGGSRQQAVEEGITPPKIRVIPNGIELPQVNPDETTRLRSELGIKREIPLVLSVGRLRPEKGHTFLIQAVPRVLERHPDTLFFLAGDGSLRDDLEVETQRLGVQAQVTFLGTRHDAPILMAAADLFVLPSVTEGMPNALLEAMGMGTAALASRLPGTEEIIQHEVNGLLVPPANPFALAQAICRLLDDDELRRRLAAAGQEHIHHHFTLARMCQRFAALLDQDYFDEQNIHA